MPLLALICLDGLVGDPPLQGQKLRRIGGFRCAGNWWAQTFTVIYRNLPLEGEKVAGRGALEWSGEVLSDEGARRKGDAGLAERETQPLSGLGEVGER